MMGHIVRMDPAAGATWALRVETLDNWRRPPGRPRATWRSTVDADLAERDLTWQSALQLADDHGAWTAAVSRGATHS